VIGRHRAVTADESASILRLHHAEHWPVGTIATELGRHHDTVERVLAQSGLPVTKLTIGSISRAPASTTTGPVVAYYT
jgi:hypothetical protein